MKHLGLRLNLKKNVLSPVQRTTFLGVVSVSTTMQAHLSPAHVESILTAVRDIRLGQELSVFKRLLGLMTAVSSVIPLGMTIAHKTVSVNSVLLKSRGFHPLNDHFRVVRVTQNGLHALHLWKKPWLLNRCLALRACCCCKNLMMNASLMGRGPFLNGHPASCLWGDPHLSWHMRGQCF